LAKIRIPDSLKKKEAIYGGKTPPEELVAEGESFFALNRLPEALDFFTAAGETARIEEISKIAVESGDIFLYTQAQKSLGRMVDADGEALSQLAANAEKAGKDRYAEKARAILLGEDEKAAEEETKNTETGESGNGDEADKKKRRKKK